MSAPMGREQVITTGPDGQQIWHVYTLPDGRTLRPGTEFTAVFATGRERVVFVHASDGLILGHPVGRYVGLPVYGCRPEMIRTVHRERTT